MISVFIIAQNEEHHLERALKSVDGFDEIVVVDSGSTDRTLDIARRYTEAVFHQDWLGCGRQKEAAKNRCTHEWVLNLDADEEVTPELREEILQFVQGNRGDALDIPFREYFLGALNHRFSRPNRHLRLFRKQAGCYAEVGAHESPIIEGSVLRARHPILHHGETSVEVKVGKINHYSSQIAHDKRRQGKKHRLLKLLLVMPLTFLKSFFLRRNFFNGRRGLIGSTVNAFYAFLKEAKLYELEFRERSPARD